jgi:uncharacterized protein
MAAFGDDFRRAKRNWLYDTPSVQGLGTVIAFTVLLLVLHFVFQSIGAIVAYNVLYAGGTDAEATMNLMKSGVVGIAPSALATCAVAWWLSKLRLLEPGNSLALHLPKLGYGGWLAVIGGFAVVMYGIFTATLVGLNIDPSTYAPTGGLSETNSKAGMVERTMVEIAKDPLATALALPGVMVFVPIAEELIFRGTLFAAIANSRLGRWGAVIITAAAWAIIHLVSAPWLFVGVIFIMGLVLGVLLLRFGSLWVTIACHIVWNSLTSAAIFGMHS